MQHLLHFSYLILFAALFIKCDDEKVTNPTSENGNILVATMLPNPDGMSGSTYMQLIDNLSIKNINNSNALPVPYGSVPIVSGNDVFSIPSFAGESDLLIKYSRIGGELVKQGEYTLPSQSGATNVVSKGDIAYISCGLIGKILVINHESMQFIKEIDITSFGVGDQNPEPSSMLIRDNHLFVPLTQMVGGYFPSPTRPYSDVLIINTDNNQVMKMITDSTSGISTPTRPIDPYSIFMDENNDIYIVGIGAWGALPGHYSGLLRIKAGETEFDKSYRFIFNTTVVNGESTPLDYVHAVRYAGNSKLYGTGNFPAYYGNPINFVTDRTVVPVEIDIAAKTIKKLDFPFSNSFGVSVGVFDDQIVFGLATSNSNGYFTYKQSTGEASSSALVKTDGFPYFFVAFE
jgi:hypothetical protein